MATTTSKKKKPSRKKPPSGKGLTFEKVWASLQETDRISKENDKKYEKWRRNAELEYQKLREETDRRMKETDRRIGDLGNRFGEMVEHMVAPSINEKFNEMGFIFENISQNHVIKDASGKCLAEIDILLENGDIVIAVEVKSKPLEKDVDRYIEKMEVLRRRADKRNDTRKFRGAIAGAIMKNEVRDYAHKTGFYVIEQTGDTVMINIPPNFKPREW